MKINENFLNEIYHIVEEKNGKLKCMKPNQGHSTQFVKLCRILMYYHIIYNQDQTQ